MVCVMITVNYRFFDGSVHPFGLAVGPGMFYLGQSVLNAVLMPHTVKRGA